MDQLKLGPFMRGAFEKQGKAYETMNDFLSNLKLHQAKRLDAMKRIEVLMVEDRKIVRM